MRARAGRGVETRACVSAVTASCPATGHPLLNRCCAGCEWRRCRGTSAFASRRPPVRGHGKGPRRCEPDQGPGWRSRCPQGGSGAESPAGEALWPERVLSVACVASVESADSWRVAGEEPWASARMRCFIVGGSALSRGRVHRTDCVGAVAGFAAVCSWLVTAGSRPWPGPWRDPATRGSRRRR